MDRLPRDGDLWTETGLPRELVERVERQPDLLNSFRHFVSPWATNAEFLPGVNYYKRLGSGIRTAPTIPLEFDDIEGYTGNAAAVLDQFNAFGNTLALDYFRKRGRQIDQLGQPEFVAGFERVARQGHQRMEARIANLGEEQTTANTMFQGLPAILLVGAANTLIISGHGDSEETSVDFTIIDEKMKDDAKIIVKGNKAIHDRYHPGYEAAMNSLRYYYNLGRDPAFFEEIVRTVAPLYVLFGELDRPPDPRHPSETPMARIVREVDEACTNLTFRMEPSIPVTELNRWQQEARETTERLKEHPDAYNQQVITLYRRLMQVRTARLLTHALSIGQLKMSDIFDTRTRIMAFHRLHGEPQATIETPDEPEPEQETIVVVDRYLDHAVLAPAVGSRPDAEGGERPRPEIVLDPRIPELDREQVRKLVEEVIIPWPWPGAELVARSLERRQPDKTTPVIIGKAISGEGGAELLQDKFYMAVLPRPVEQADGTTVISSSAVAAHPDVAGHRHAIFIADGRRGIDEQGNVVTNYADMALRNKGTARNLGAERILHVGEDPFKRALDRLLGPLRPLRRGRVIGAFATETAMDGEPQEG